MHAFLRHMEQAAKVGAQIETILHQHRIRTRGRLDHYPEDMFGISHEARRKNISLEWSVVHRGDAETDCLAIVLRIETPDRSRRILQQFKLLLILKENKWTCSTAGQLGFALYDGQSDLDEATVMKTVDKMAGWFVDPQRRIPALSPQRDE